MALAGNQVSACLQLDPLSANIAQLLGHNLNDTNADLQAID
jgi:hypothetical protein